MSPSVATCVFIIVIAGLFFLNRDREARTSKALWLPVVWLFIAGSRPVSVWLQGDWPHSLSEYLDGSPFDRAIYTTLLAAGVAVLFWRQRAVVRFFRANWPVLLFVFYCAASIAWSDYPDVAFKRWIKSLGDYVMILIVLTDTDPLCAIKRALSRAGFLLLPLSVLLIKYYPLLGRGYAVHWVGTAYFVGVAADKNMLGMVCMVFGLGSAWRFFQELQSGGRSNGKGPLIAHGVILAMALWLFWMANSMTSLACFGMAGVLLAATSIPRLARKPWLVHLLAIAMLSLTLSVLFLNVGSGIVEDMGRDRTLTGRTELWGQVVKMNPSPIVGAGFESFWLGTRLEKLWDIYWWHPNESHNGFIEVYLNLGWVGLALLAMIMVTGYKSVTRLLKQDPEAGRLCLAYLFVGVAYNFTEAAIRTTGLVWIAFMMAIILARKAASIDKQRIEKYEALHGASDSPIEVIAGTSRPVAIGSQKLFHAREWTD
jgi:exopolysaccharide production protein ExoQ